MENNKPITLLREDFINGVAMLVNQSNLPFFVIEESLKQVTNGVADLARQQLEQDRQAYQQSLMAQQMEFPEAPVEKVTGEVVEE